MIRDHITSLDSMFDVIALSETWLNDDKNDSFNLDGYDLVTCSRRSKKGGGVGLYVRNSMQHKYLPLLSKCIANCAEIVTAEVTLKNGKRLIICCIYRAPNTDLALLNEHINLICSKNNSKNIYICGDFNVDLLQYDKHVETNNFIDQLYSHGLQPLITRPTRITRDTKTQIDNIFTTDLNSHKQSGILINDISDPLPVYVVTRYIQKETLNKTCIKKRVINYVTKKAFITDLEKCNWDEILAEEDVNITYNKFVNLFTNLFNTNCPVNVSKCKQGKIKYKRPDKPWMTTGLKKCL